MKNFCLFLLMSLVLVACSNDPDFLSTVEAIPNRNAKASELNGKANLAAAASVDAAMNAGATQFLGTWKVTHFNDTDYELNEGEDSKEVWNEEEKGQAPWVTFYNDGTMVGDTVSHYFPTGQYIINGDWVVMFSVEGTITAKGSTLDYHAKLAVAELDNYVMKAVYTGSTQSPIGEDSFMIWMQKQEQ